MFALQCICFLSLLWKHWCPFSRLEALIFLLYWTINKLYSLQVLFRPLHKAFAPTETWVSYKHTSTKIICVNVCTWSNAVLLHCLTVYYCHNNNNIVLNVVYSHTVAGKDKYLNWTWAQSTAWSKIPRWGGVSCLYFLPWFQWRPLLFTRIRNQA